MYFIDGQIHIEQDDQCFSCEFFQKGIACPLLEALGEGVVYLDGDIQVSNCGFYKPFKRHLKVIDPTTPASEHTETASPDMAAGAETADQTVTDIFIERKKNL